MVISYLEKIREKLQDNRININSLLTATNNEYRENEEFIKVLEENNDSSFESFTPRTVNGFNKRKIEELIITQKELSKKKDVLTEELHALDSELEEVNQVIKVARENKKIIDNM